MADPVGLAVLALLALLLERIVEIRAKDTWRNVRAALDSIKVFEYERDGVRVRQTTDLRPEAAALLLKPLHSAHAQGAHVEAGAGEGVLGAGECPRGPEHDGCHAACDEDARARPEPPL
ncbi:MAG: hypothetical protein JWM10_3158 [Myxococcaceae bacterium]|nr:hypothetical protein [Myxococcaceae bacterium]